MLAEAYGWLLRSGIREAGGGVARYYCADLQQNSPISTEITGYAVSALLHLRSLASGGEAGQDSRAGVDAAMQSASYLARTAWSLRDSAFPFEPESPHAYFFDTGIVVRGLLAAWKTSGDKEIAERANDGALSLAFDFLGDGVFHPIVSLPEKQPLPYEAGRWSRNPGCYQLKSALAWKERAEAFDGSNLVHMFDDALVNALAGHAGFLPGAKDPHQVMDRLHPYCYFLEGLLSVADHGESQAALKYGIERVAAMLRDISPSFERSDVCAQLLRIRLIAHHLHGLPLDERAAEEEARRVTSYQARSDDTRIDGGFWFGRKGDAIMPFVNPVSTVFSMQALALWQNHCAGQWEFENWQLI